jgi:hypothetical protein
MAKITKRAVDALQPDKRRDVFAWDSVSISAEQLPCTYGLYSVVSKPSIRESVDNNHNLPGRV